MSNDTYPNPQESGVDIRAAIIFRLLVLVAVGVVWNAIAPGLSLLTVALVVVGYETLTSLLNWIEVIY